MHDSTTKRAIFLMGPTAAGKTKMVLDLSHKLPIDIISVDSAMIYRGMDIGTGKPSLAELALAPHALINILEPVGSYSVANFCHDAIAAMQTSQQNNRIPVLVGGTMMYFKALQYGLAILPAQNPTIRAEILAAATQTSWQAQHSKLLQLDPITAAKIHPNDPQRIQRALEVIYITGKPMAEYLGQNNSLTKDWAIKLFALAPITRAELHTNIATRFKLMLKCGFIEEVELLLKHHNLHADLPSMRAVGYRQILAYLSNTISHDTMQEQALAATRQLAKRQLTWLRSWPNLNWITPGETINLDF